jgi:hypothetical protein
MNNNDSIFADDDFGLPDLDDNQGATNFNVLDQEQEHIASLFAAPRPSGSSMFRDTRARDIEHIASLFAAPRPSGSSMFRDTRARDIERYRASLRSIAPPQPSIPRRRAAAVVVAPPAVPPANMIRHFDPATDPLQVLPRRRFSEEEKAFYKLIQLKLDFFPIAPGQ